MRILMIASGTEPFCDETASSNQMCNIYLRYNDEREENDEIFLYSPHRYKKIYDKNIYKKSRFIVIDFYHLWQKIINKAIVVLHESFIKAETPDLFIYKVIKNYKKRFEDGFFDLILFENNNEYVTYFSKKTNCKTRIALHVHNLYGDDEPRGHFNAEQYFDELWCVSDFVAQRMREKVKNKKIYVLPNCVTSSIRKKENYIERVGKMGIFTFIYTGKLYSGKGVLELVEAFNLFNEAVPNSRLLIAGDVRKRCEKPYRRALKEKACKNVIFLGKVSHNKISDLYNEAHVLISPSIIDETFGMVLLEGMNANIPIIATDSGAYPEVGDGKILIVHRGNLIDNIYKMMLYVYENYSKIMRSLSYTEILNKYSAKNFCENFYNLCHGGNNGY